MWRPSSRQKLSTALYPHSQLTAQIRPNPIFRLRQSSFPRHDPHSFLIRVTPAGFPSDISDPVVPAFQPVRSHSRMSAQNDPVPVRGASLGLIPQAPRTGPLERLPKQVEAAVQLSMNAPSASGSSCAIAPPPPGDYLRIRSAPRGKRSAACFIVPRWIIWLNAAGVIPMKADRR